MEHIKIKTISFWGRAAILAAGFGIGGALWGLEAYRGTVGSDEVFTNPFSYILGAVALGVFGGLALAYISLSGVEGLGQNQRVTAVTRWVFSKNTLKIVGFGTLGWLVGFVVPMMWAEWLFLSGSILLPFLLGIFTIPLGFIGLDHLIEPVLAPSLILGNLWLEFFVVGFVATLIYSLILKRNVLKIILWGSVGFALASLIAPVLGNLIGNLFSSLFISYLFTFLIIGIILGFSLSFGIIKKEKEGSTNSV